MDATTKAGANVGQNVVCFRFSVGQKVTINAIDTPGFVKALLVDSDGKNYNIAYFDDDKVRRTEWLYEAELS